MSEGVHTLTYPGKTDIPAGTPMGRGMNGKIWSVLGCEFVESENKTKVSFEEFIQQ